MSLFGTRFGNSITRERGAAPELCVLAPSEMAPSEIAPSDADNARP